MSRIMGDASVFHAGVLQTRTSQSLRRSVHERGVTGDSKGCEKLHEGQHEYKTSLAYIEKWQTLNAIPWTHPTIHNS